MVPVMDKTLADYITRTLAKLELEKQRQVNLPPVSEPNDYEVWPEDNNYDLPRNPYSRV